MCLGRLSANVLYICLVVFQSLVLCLDLNNGTKNLYGDDSQTGKSSQWVRASERVKPTKILNETISFQLEWKKKKTTYNSLQMTVTYQVSFFHDLLANKYYENKLKRFIFMKVNEPLLSDH